MTSMNLLRRLARHLPPEVRHQLSAARLRAALAREARQMQRREPALPAGRLLVVPSDPHTLFGARGDYAMIGAVVERLRRANPVLRTAVITGSAGASQAARAVQMEPLEVWEPFSLPVIAAAIARFQPDAVVLIGADVMDGHYSVRTTLRLLAVIDLAAHSGAVCSVTGFSFNATAAPVLAADFVRVAKR